MKHSRTAAPPPFAMKLTGAALILFPLLLAISWGAHFADEVYSLLQLARRMAYASLPVLADLDNLAPSIQTAYLFAFLISIPARFGIDPSTAALILSALGWTLAAFVLVALGFRLHRSFGALVAALLLSFNPGIINTLGSPISWMVAIFWFIILFSARRRIIASVVFTLLLVALLVQWPTGINLARVGSFGLALVWSIFLFTAAVGFEWMAGLLSKRDLVHLSRAQTINVLLFVFFIGIGVYQVFMLWQIYQRRPIDQWQLEEQVAAWLSSNTPPQAMLLSDERIAYLAERTTAAVPDLSHADAAAAIQDRLKENPVDYLLTTTALPFRQLSEAVWLRLSYEPVQQFYAASVTSAPYTIWAYRQPLDELGERYSINARVPDRLSILGYQLGPRQVQPGDSVRMALYLQAPEAANGHSVPFEAIVRLVSPVDGKTISEWRINLPQSVSPSGWQANDVLTEQLPLAMPNDLPAGAYQLNLSLVGSDSPELWPFSLDNDVNQLDRIPIGDLIVPWTGSLENTQQLEALFADQIALRGFSIGDAMPGEPLDVSLYWEANQAVDENYVVFVHFLSSDGELLATHDSWPENGRFPTSSWPRGIIIPDNHQVLIPAGLPSGEYLLKAGLYQPDTGERLSPTSSTADISVDSAVLLTKISLP